MTITLNKWHIKLGMVSDYSRMAGMTLHIGIFKVHTRPPEGEVIRKTHYYGFWFKKYIREIIILDI